MDIIDIVGATIAGILWGAVALHVLGFAIMCGTCVIAKFKEKRD